jgi:hypothetical protein
MISSKHMDDFNRVAKRPFKSQAIFFLNLYWEECFSDAEKIWEYYQGFKDLDPKDKACDLDEFYAHKFLESLGQTMTALELRNALKDIDVNHDHRMCLLEYLIFKYNKSADDLLGRRSKVEIPLEEKADMSEDLVKAITALQTVQTEIERIEKKKSDLEEKSQAGGVKGNAAKQELFELLNNDPTELNAALLKAEAAMRKVTNSKDAGSFGKGQVWFLNRELEEAKKYQPKGGKGKKKLK